MSVGLVGVALIGRPRCLGGFRWGLGRGGPPIGPLGSLGWAAAAGAWAAALGGMIPRPYVLPVLVGASGAVIVSALVESLMRSRREPRRRNR